jgi:hypothetical protein
MSSDGSTDGMARGLLCQPQRQLPVEAVVSLDELVNVVWHVAHLQVASAAQLLGNVGRDILRPAFEDVEGDDAGRVFVLTREKVEDHGFPIGGLDVGFPIDADIPAKVVDHEIDVLIVTHSARSRRPTCSRREPFQWHQPELVRNERSIDRGPNLEDRGPLTHGMA